MVTAKNQCKKRRCIDNQKGGKIKTCHCEINTVNILICSALKTYFEKTHLYWACYFITCFSRSAMYCEHLSMLISYKSFLLTLYR